MSEPNLLSLVANLLRPVSNDVSKGKGKLCLSTIYLNKLNKAFNEHVPEDLTSSFHLTEAKASIQIDLQFLLDLVKGTVALKITPDLIEDEDSNVVNLRRFQNIKILEIHKIDVSNIIGIQKLRSHIEDLTCMYNLQNLGDILNKCGGDFSHNNNWTELKRVNFSHNFVHDIDSSFECTPWLQVLDLSHNQIRNLEFIDHLPNLKRLNLSYNKLEKVPRFKGQICKRLQVVLLNSNFIEDISGLSTLSHLHQLDLAQNCLTNHNTLLAISQMPSLYSLDLRGNPINFHPIHRTLTCNYLNKNTASLNFILDNVPLSKMEKSLAGSLYPLTQSSLGSNGSFSSQNSLENSVQDKQKRVRNVTIQEGHEIKIVREKKKSESVTPSPRSTDRSHLDVKSRVEQLRQEYGERWLSQESAEIFQGMLKFPETSTPSRDNLTPSPNVSDVTDHSQNIFVSAPGSVVTRGDSTNDTFVTCPVKSDGDDDDNLEDNDVYSNTKEEPAVEPTSDDDDLVDGEIFLGGTVPDSNDLCVVVTDTHLSERDSVTSKEKARWNINVVKSCISGAQPNEVKLEFDTFRSDRMSRTYYLDDSEKFVKLVFEGMVKNKVPENKVQYQCMKCNIKFSKTKIISSVLEENSVTCPKCDSNLIIEST